ncbi:MAG: Si-specific NAD(P)(+) transhydrogenase [Deltaproteobacteria bacterium]|nr:Si-specific NAD(P)(+) transhydrogenase [Deltaproteobacteria bacterium]
MSRFDYDLVAIGCGPAGQKAALQSAKLRKRTAIVDEREVVGGICTNIGTIPSKSFREAVLYLSGFRQRAIYGAGYRVKSKIEMKDLTYRCAKIIASEVEVIRSQLARNNVDVITGRGSLEDEHTVVISKPDGHKERITSEFIVIATGAKPYHPQNIQFDQRTVLDSDFILTLPELPKSMIVVGGGVIGVEYATMFAALGVAVTLVDGRKRLLGFIDEEIVENLKYQMRTQGITLRLGEEVTQVKCKDNDSGVVVELSSKKVLVSDVVLISAGRTSATDGLNLESVGVKTGERGKIVVDSQFRTSVPNIFAVGDVIGFPALASTSANQGRIAALAAFGLNYQVMEYPLPFGIYSIPEISMVGLTEEEATEKNIPYEVGIARYKDCARGAIIGDMEGMLKLLINRQDKSIVGIHVIGENASELVHIGQAAMSLKGTLNYFLDTVFNFPTLAECYKIAAYNCFNKLQAAEEL